MDADRHTKTTEIGSTSFALKDVRGLRAAAAGQDVEPIRQSYVFTQRRQVIENVLSFVWAGEGRIFEEIHMAKMEEKTPYFHT